MYIKEDFLNIDITNYKHSLEISNMTWKKIDILKNLKIVHP